VYERLFWDRNFVDDVIGVGLWTVGLFGKWEDMFGNGRMDKGLDYWVCL
jgi:hypothetical protein